MDSNASPASVLVWFRDDLRTDDNPALAAALSDGMPVIGLFLLDEDTDSARAPGGAARWWLHHSLEALAEKLSALGIPLVLRRGKALDEVPRLAAEASAGAIVWNRRYDPSGVATDKALKKTLRDAGLRVESFNGSLLVEPWEVQTKAGDPFRVFSPFHRAMQSRGEPARPRDLKMPSDALPDCETPDSDDLADWRLLPVKPDWAGGLRDTWTPGEEGALSRLSGFLEDGLAGYAAHRDEPAAEVTSRLSPHLRFGEISPRRIWHEAKARAGQDGSGIDEKALSKFHAELGWREFSYHLLFHFPEIVTDNFQPRFDEFPWADNPEGLRAWTRGRTGYPLVDAGMRELWHTGYIHNRVRMVVASFLVKHLLVDWREGEAWFWDTLVDADPANNPASWQWVAGSGADAAPYFRIFNPQSQGEKFDPDGDYTRRWVPELANLPDKWLFKPHEAPSDVLKDAGVRLGHTYPRPIIDHRSARERALEAFEHTKSGA
uniref:cryptochrome/photolyase family protein n=1 Tax=Stappia sp. TaxID=1870903 RepID=UPI003BAC90F5